MPDRMVKCVECGTEFPFTEGEQEYYKKNNFNDPKRCKNCRENRKAKRQADGRPREAKR